MSRGRKARSRRGNKVYVSKGEVSTISSEMKKMARREYLESGTRLLNQLSAWKKGRNVVLTVPNPNPNQTNKRFVRLNASYVWGNPKTHEKKEVVNAIDE